MEGESLDASGNQSVPESNSKGDDVEKLNLEEMYDRFIIFTNLLYNTEDYISVLDTA